MDRQKIKNSIIEFDFKKIFNELGWDNHTQELDIQLNEYTFRLRAVAIKKEFVAFVCLPDGNGREPDYQIRKKLETKVTPFAFEHIIIFYDQKKSVQIWQWVKRELGKPTATRETKFYSYQDPELLVQKLVNLKISLDDEETLGITDIRNRTKKAFDVEKITKEFYTRFKKEHDVFQNFIEGITDEIDKDWYSSLMLNRLMFIYFIQKKHFLNNDPDYLRTKLNEVQHAQGKDKFYSFYNSFLLVLFHKGLGSPERTSDIIKLLGKIPYLNGGLFDIHQLEHKYVKIDIPDKAFEKIFDFFDLYEWHLDTRIKAKGNEINPDVIGYIFEKYINDRASMGAYYTKEDITDYISKNCIIPFLVDETIRNYKNNAFDDAFKMLKIEPNKYIYPAVKYGIPQQILDTTTDISDQELFDDLPDDIKTGFRPDLENKIVDGQGEYLCDIRKSWNNSAPPEIALPTEIYREVIERRKRCKEIINKAIAGEINSINDFITYNLNIRQFMQDVIENTDDPFLLKELYKAIKNIKILDPTCGSGAFLFAALNILEPLYEACIQRMQNFVDDSKFISKQKGDEKSVKFKFFEDEIKQINSPEHPNEKYFIYKSIILNNLHGVDIMNEAVEIAKLRLFLKLAGTVDADQNKQNLGLEPLPDIDFNIRAGNTLVGFVNIQEVEKIIHEQAEIKGALVFGDELEIVNDIKEKAEIVSKVFSHFKDAQLLTDSPTEKGAKHELEERLNQLNEKLNEYLAKQYGIDKSIKPKEYNQWKETHKPFHWLSEFYEIIAERGGFDVIIGNPPYVEYTKKDKKTKSSVSDIYKLLNFRTINSSNLFSFTIEKANLLNKEMGFNGFIVPLSATSTATMLPLRNLIFNNVFYSWNSYYSASDQPASLFSGVRHRLLITINLKKSNNDGTKFSTNFLKWFSEERCNLFESIISYQNLTKNKLIENSKISNSIEIKIMNSIFKKKILENSFGNGKYPVYYHNAPVHWGKVFDFVPYFNKDGATNQSSHIKNIYFKNETDAAVVICLLNSSFFYWFNWQYSNCRDLSLIDIQRIPISLDSMEVNLKNQFLQLKTILMEDYKKKSKIYKRVSDGILTEFDSFYPMNSKSIIDEIDKVLAEHYGFTGEELDFIINYDIKYRMGKELDEGE
ncbi:MAG: DNA methyltransferase [Chloroherpetonaceae bacterium]